MGLIATSRRTWPLGLGHRKTPLTHHLVVNSGSFSEFIVMVNIPDKFKLPMTLHPYDGTGDPKFTSLCLNP